MSIIESNSLGKETAEQLANALLHTTTLEELDLCNTFLFLLFFREQCFRGRRRLIDTIIISTW